MTVTLRLDGVEQLSRALAEMTQEIKDEVGKAVNATGLDLRGDIVKRYQRGPASGKTYEKYNPRRTHVASAPGEAPATDTGRLASSVEFKREDDLSVTVGSALVYAAALEFGAPSQGIAPRPAWVPAAEAMRPKFRRRLERAIEEAMK